MPPSKVCQEMVEGAEADGWVWLWQATEAQGYLLGGQLRGLLCAKRFPRSAFAQISLARKKISPGLKCFD